MTTKEQASKIGKSNVSRSKASERRIAKLLTEWTGTGFRRRRVEGRDIATRALDLTADVIPVEADCKFSVEVKIQKGFSLDALMDNPRKALFTEWWHQATYDSMLMAKTVRREVWPLVFFKPHPNHDWLAFPTGVISQLRPVDQEDGRHPGLWFSHLVFDQYERLGLVAGDVSHSKKNTEIVELPLMPVVFCRWRDFKEQVDPKSIFI